MPTHARASEAELAQLAEAVNAETRAKRAREIITEAIEAYEGSVLRAWLQHLDPQHQCRVDKRVFSSYMKKLGIRADPVDLFKALDREDTGEIQLQDISETADYWWQQIREFLVFKYGYAGGAEEFLRREGQGGKTDSAKKISASNFRKALSSGGNLAKSKWDLGNEDFLFDALSGDRNFIVAADVKWFDLETKRVMRREIARRKASDEAPRQKQDTSHLLRDFNRRLKQKHGCLIRGWRKDVFPADNMVLQKGQFLKACAEMGWKQNAKGLWNELDRDGSGSVTLDEIDYKLAVQLARFRNFLVDRYGNSRRAFAALDRSGTLKVSEAEFYEVMTDLGFEGATPSLFAAIDMGNTGRVYGEDLMFLDKWKPREFLTAKPNSRAAEHALAKLHRRYGTFLRAWRYCIDTDGSNRANWDEFKNACKTVEFTGDLPGAWKALDKESRGYIMLKDIDPVTSHHLINFRKFAVDQFGGVRSCFDAFDVDESAEVTFNEFKRACRIYGFQGAIKPIFKALNASADGNLTVDEIVFLDHWKECKEKEEAKIINEEELADEIPAGQERRGAICCSTATADEIAFQCFSHSPSDPDVPESFNSREWPSESLHPAFRVWANNRRRVPIRTAKGELPSLSAQVDLSPHSVKRPVLLMAPVPENASVLKVHSAREPRELQNQQEELPRETHEVHSARERCELRDQQKELPREKGSPRKRVPDAARMPSLDALLSPTRTPRYRLDKAWRPNLS
eukprot:TRINITY_DN91483_c0_g1_i1.p1 TRINITY_DN91483_c0_g1~~TRINITY_DN91483_c0_g1_i1.p1  ORF type:complete len:741 (-),score=152.27 TRINITY_DN91483_c0_g1_i1:108-2330(-)